MNKKFWVICEESCPDCKGARYFPDPDWQDYMKWEKALKDRTGLKDPDLTKQHGNEILDWWRERGHEVSDFSRGQFPPEEYPCDTCGATGVYRHEVNLLEALEELGKSDLTLAG